VLLARVHRLVKAHVRELHLSLLWLLHALPSKPACPTPAVACRGRG
jgi:hypothetical protein